MIWVRKFNEDSVKEFWEGMSKAHETGQSIIPVVVDSYGGSVDSLFSMLDAIRASILPVATVCTSKAMSCGIVLLSGGTPGHRYISPLSRVMVHDVAAGANGKIEEIKSTVAETERVQKELLKCLDKHANQKPGYFNGMVHDRARADWYMTAEEAKEHGLVDIIGTPQFRVDIDVKFHFGIGA